MTLADLALTAFALCNSARALAYVPQLICAGRDRNGASAVSLTTWTLFAVSNVSTSAYAIVQLGDLAVACVFALNTFFCLAIVGVAACKRLRHRRFARAERESWARVSRHRAGVSLRKIWPSYSLFAPSVGALACKSHTERTPR
jgi:hypothetical protein